MAEIVKAYRQHMNALRFIGRKYGDADRVNGSFGAKWGEWFQNGWFETIERQVGGNIRDIYEDGDAYIGLMREDGDRGFEYWIGMFTPEGTAVPEGFAFVDMPAGDLGVCWVYGRENEVYMREGDCARRLEADGFTVTGPWCFERYGCPRFTTPDAQGNVILDICFTVK